MTIKLSDTHLVILSTAAGREDRTVLPIPQSVKARGKVLDAVLTKLLRLELIEVCKLEAGEIGWAAHDQASSPTGLKLTTKGFKALGVLPTDEANSDEATISAEVDANSSRCVTCGAKTSDKDGSPVPANMFPPEPDILGPLTKAEKEARKTSKPVRAGTKEALLLATLSEPNGASIFDMMEATGWLPHTCRAALTRLRQKGFAIERLDDPSTGSRYRVIGNAGGPQ